MDNTLERKEAFIKAKKDMDAIIKGLNADIEANERTCASYYLSLLSDKVVELYEKFYSREPEIGECPKDELCMYTAEILGAIGESLTKLQSELEELNKGRTSEAHKWYARLLAKGAKEQIEKDMEKYLEEAREAREAKEPKHADTISEHWTNLDKLLKEIYYGTDNN